MRSNELISIVIRCYNEAQHIGRLLNGILQQNLENIEIIVVDSGSTDETVSIASQYPIKLVRIKPSDFSFGYALNVGCRYASGELVVIVSAHVFPIYRDWLENLIAPFEEEKIALTYGKQRGDNSTRYSERQIFSTWFPDIGNTMAHQNHPFCNNANAAIRRSLWTQLPYNETLTGLEDLEWAKRAIALDYKIAYVAEAEIVHVHRESAQKIFNRYRREAIALKQIYPNEKFSLGDFIRLFVSNVVSDYFHAVRENLILRYLVDIPVFRLTQFWGTYRGYAQQEPISAQLRQTFYYARGLDRSYRETPNTQRQPINYA